MLGQEQERKGDLEAAKHNWEKAIAIRPQYGEAIYSLSRLLSKTDPAQAELLRTRFQKMQQQNHIVDRAQSLGNFALASADAHDWPKAISQLKEAIQICGGCVARPQLHKDLGLIYCHSGDLKDGHAELLEAQRLAPHDADVEHALKLLDSASKSQ
jgi:tetratricopeptide (TPR) repeat protein